MADPLSSIASLIAIVQISGKIVSICYEYRSTASKASEQQIQLTNEVKSLRDAFESLVNLVEQHVGSDSSFPAVEALCQKDGVLEQCKRELDSLEARLLPAKGWKAVGKTLKWPLSEPEVTKSLNRINRLKTTVLLALNTDQAAASFKIQNSNLDIKVNTNRLTEDVEALSLQKKHEEFMKWLSPPDCSRSHSTAVQKIQAGTGEWVLSSDKYRDWVYPSGSALWIHGIPGSGKTVLSSHIIEQLQSSSDESDVRGVVYFYFDTSNEMQRTPESFLKAVITQLMTRYFHVRRKLYAYAPRGSYRQKFEGFKGTSPARSDLIELFQRSLQRMDRLFIILDALDECNDVEELMSIIRHLWERFPGRFNLLVTSRQDWCVADTMSDMSATNLSLSGPMLDADICLHIECCLQTHTRLKNWQPELKAEIEHTLLAGAQGMFRWVDCQIDTLRRCLKPQAVRKTLLCLPKTLTETYDSIILGINEEYLEDAKRVLQHLACSKRPLRLTELAEILAVDFVNGASFDPANRLLDVRDLLEICSSLITIELGKASVGQEEVLLAHSTVREYLVSNNPTSPIRGSLGFREEEAHHMITSTCLAYLGYFNTADSYTDIIKFPFAEYAARYWFHHYHEACDYKDLDQLLFSLFDDSDMGRRCFSNWQNIHHVDRPWAKQLKNKEYTNISPLYCASLLGLDCVVLQLINKGQDLDHQCGIFGNALQAAVYKNHLSTIGLLLANGADPNLQGGKCGSSLMAACVQGNAHIVDALIKSGADISKSSWSRGTPLILAAEQGHERVVNQLLDYGADVNNGTGKMRDTALSVAARRGHDSMCRLLVQRGAVINGVRGGDSVQEAVDNGFFKVADFLLRNTKHTVLENNVLETNHAEEQKSMPEVLKQLDGGAYRLKNLLRSAVQAGSLDIVQQSLDSGADINWSSEFDMSTLLLAAKHGQDDVVQILLQRGADINAQDKFFGNAVHAAARSGHLSTVRLLLEYEPPANIHVLGPVRNGESYHGTVLQAATASGNPGVVDYLLQTGVDVNESSCEVGNALGTASYCGDVEVARLLLNHGADIKSNIGKFGTALHRGAASGNLLMVQELLKHGADPNILGGDLVTTLEVAAKIGHAEIISVLLGHGARTEVHEDDDRTFGKESKGALGVAASQGWVSIFNQLLDAGADPHHVHPYSSTTGVQEAARAGHTAVIATVVDRNIVIDPSDLVFHALRSRRTGSDFTSFNPIFSSADYLDHLAYLLDLGADPNYQDPTTSDFPLVIAARQEHQVKIVSLLISRGADVNRQNRDGWTALLEAVKSSQRDMIKSLVEEHHADISKTLINGSTAFHVAAQTGYVSTIDLLLDKGQDIDQVNKNEDVALHIAIENERLGVVEALLRQNANINIPNAQGMTAIDLAEFNNSPDSVKNKHCTKMILKALQEHVAGKEE